MDITEIENLSAAELKARRKELAAALEGEDVKVLAARYVQARMDAALRDEKMAEQGETIKSLNAALSSLDGRFRTLAERYTGSLTAAAKVLNDAIAAQKIDAGG